jgi:hypothetical protein
MKEFGGLALWILGYVAVSQVGYTINTRVLTSGSPGGVTAYSNAWLLFQLPYGVIGVSLLTAIMPRMSRAAADGDHKKLIGDLSYASRMSTVLLVPISAVVQGPSQARVAQVDAQSRLHFTDVTLGRNLGTEVEILSGIAAGDAVVMSPNSLLADGAEVRVRASAAPVP